MLLHQLLVVQYVPNPLPHDMYQTLDGSNMLQIAKLIVLWLDMTELFKLEVFSETDSNNVLMQVHLFHWVFKLVIATNLCVFMCNSDFCPVVFYHKIIWHLYTFNYPSWFSLHA